MRQMRSKGKSTSKGKWEKKRQKQKKRKQEKKRKWDKKRKKQKRTQENREKKQKKSGKNVHLHGGYLHGCQGSLSTPKATAHPSVPLKAARACCSMYVLCGTQTQRGIAGTLASALQT